MAKQKRPSTKTLNRDIASYQELRTTIKKAEAELSEVKERLLDAAVLNGGAIEGAKAVVKAITTERRTIQADKLTERGVTPKIIAYATKATLSTYARVTEKKIEVG